MSLLLACALIVHDGDTLRCGKERIRLDGIDAPETRGSPRCSSKSRKRLAGSRNKPWCNYKLGIKSRDALRAFVGRGRARIDRQGKDRYGRTLATITVNGVDAGEHLISRGLARPWR